ncbi:MAG TPA: carbohydrate kinase family protein [Anaerolineales bacterium]|nr:carbohydrate kinase family protein [Anaerolineales bacterium]
MEPQFLVFGQLTREYLLPPVGPPQLDMPGGGLLYAAAGLRVWEAEIGLVGRVGNDYPREWLNICMARGLDTSGIRILAKDMDIREFVAYTESFEASRINPVSHFARREMTFPKSLFGYQPPDPKKKPDEARMLIVTDIPNDYLTARAALLCPMALVTQTQLIAGMKRGSVHTFVLDPGPATMIPTARRELPALLNGVTAFLPSQEELYNLFWGETHDLWEMAEAVSIYGCEYVVIKCGARGQLLYDTNNKRRWEIPAYPARLADPTGAGDAFCGGFLAGYCKNYDPLEGVLYGNISASLKLEGSGAFYPLDVLPGLAEARLGALRDMVREV